MNRIRLFLHYRLARYSVKLYQRKLRMLEQNAYKHLPSEELALVLKIEKMAKNNRSGIRYDIETGETLIIANDYLIILIKGRIEVYNHTGFIQISIPDVSFSKLRSVIDREAHIERRKLKHQTKENIRAFIDRIS